MVACGLTYQFGITWSPLHKGNEIDLTVFYMDLHWLLTRKVGGWAEDKSESNCWCRGTVSNARPVKKTLYSFLNPSLVWKNCLKPLGEEKTNCLSPNTQAKIQFFWMRGRTTTLLTQGSGITPHFGGRAQESPIYPLRKGRETSLACTMQTKILCFWSRG